VLLECVVMQFNIKEFPLNIIYLIRHVIKDIGGTGIYTYTHEIENICFTNVICCFVNLLGQEV